MSRHLAAVFSDWHIHNYKRYNDNSSRLKNCISVLFDLAEFCRANGITTILFSGDLYDTQKALLTEVVNETIKAFQTFEKDYPEITIYGISGNHDHSTKNTLENPAVSALEHIAMVCSNFVLIDDKQVEIEEGLTITGIPYYEYKEQFEQRLEEATVRVKEYGAEKNFLLIHQTPAGIVNDLIPFEANPRDPRFREFDYVFCGHIHGRQDLWDNFSLVGNPIHRDLADEGKEKGFLVMNLRKPEKGYKFFELKGYPKFVSIYEDEEIEEGIDYVVRRPRLDTAKLQEEAKVDDFRADLSAKELITNFWKEAEGKDEELLEVGLSFIGSLNPNED